MERISVQKQKLRDTLKKRSAEISPDSKRMWDTKICSHIVNFSAYKQAKSIAVFLPLPDEPDIQPVLHDAWKCGKTVAVPRVEGTTLSLRKIITSRDTAIGRFGIREPKPTTPVVSPSSLGVVFIPGQAFDRRGNRLGRGHGYYDRLLAHIRKPTIGICYSFRLVERVPHDEHDRRVHGIITEKRQ